MNQMEQVGHNEDRHGGNEPFQEKSAHVFLSYA